jgi:hypothetical protein
MAVGEMCRQGMRMRKKLPLNQICFIAFDRSAHCDTNNSLWG